MSITVDNVHSFLAEKDLLAPEALLDGDFEATSMPRRNRNVRTTSNGFGSYLVKQPEDGDEQRASLRQELRFYGACLQEPAAAPIRPFLPRLAYASASEGVLVLDLLRDASPLWRHYEARTAEDFPVDVAEALGRVLSALHRTFRGLTAELAPSLDFLGSDRPWVMDLHRPSPTLLRGLGPAGHELLALIQSHSDLRGPLDETHRLWRCDTVIHGDVKLDNILVRAPDDPLLAEAGLVCLVDWELVQFGDSAWDLGGALHDFLVWWIVTLPSASTVEEMLAGERFPLSVLRPASQRFWHGYTAARALDGDEPGELLHRAVWYAAARLVQTCFELAGGSVSIPPPSLLMLQLASNMWKDVTAAAADLFGLAEGE